MIKVRSSYTQDLFIFVLVLSYSRLDIWKSIILQLKKYYLFYLFYYFPCKIIKLFQVEKGYKALNQLFVDALIKKQDKHQVDIAIGRL